MSEVRYWQHAESGHVNMARRGGGPDGVAERDPIWQEVTVAPVDGLRPDSDVIEQAARERAWREYRDGPGYVPTDRYDVRSAFDAAWNAAHPSRTDADVAERVASAEALLRRAITAHRDLHKVYGNTSACRGGIGGQVLTAHCGATCHNPVHDAERAAWTQVEDDFFAHSHATPPVAATEVVSGYTSHGHRIAGVVQTGRPTSVARCGGPGLCTVCSREAAATGEGDGR